MAIKCKVKRDYFSSLSLLLHTLIFNASHDWQTTRGNYSSKVIEQPNVGVDATVCAPGFTGPFDRTSQRNILIHRSEHTVQRLQTELRAQAKQDLLWELTVFPVLPLRAERAWARERAPPTPRTPCGNSEETPDSTCVLGTRAPSPKAGEAFTLPNINAISA